jgi:hypothetical protein
MRNFTSLVFALLLVFICSNQMHAQQSAADLAKIETGKISNWRKANPDVKMISLQYFLQLTEEEQLQLAQSNNRFLYEGDKVSWADIQAYESTGEGQISLATFNNELQETKNWRKNNPQVKIISMQTFQQMTSQERAQLNNIPHIIFNKMLRWSDIQAYQGAIETNNSSTH